jgi:hypothetical protein
MKNDEIEWESFAANGGKTFTATIQRRAVIIASAKSGCFTSTYFENDVDPMPSGPLTPEGKAGWVAWAALRDTLTVSTALFADAEEAKEEAEEWLWSESETEPVYAVYEVLLTVSVDRREVNHPEDWDWSTLIEEAVDVISVDLIEGDEDGGYEDEDGGIHGWYLMSAIQGDLLEWNHTDGRVIRMDNENRFSFELMALSEGRLKFVRSHGENKDVPLGAIVANNAQIEWVESLQRRYAACLEVS